MNRYKMLNNFFSHFLFIFIPSFLSLLITMMIYKLCLLFLPESFTLWLTMITIFYFIPTTALTIFLLQKWNSNPKFIYARLFSTNREYVQFDIVLLKSIVESLTLFMTFLILIITPFGVKTLDNPFDSLLFTIYPISLGLIIWEYFYIRPEIKKKNTYHPKRKWH